MKLLEQLEEHMEIIEKDSQACFDFLQDIKIRKEENPTYKLSGPQFKWLCDLHTKYCGGR